MIWQFAIGELIIHPTWRDLPKPARLTFFMEGRISLFQPPPQRFAIFRVCRQIYSEAATHALHVTVFRFHDLITYNSGLHVQQTASERLFVGFNQASLI
jgi:hypothetical protein